jgi:hypothetical protein
VPFVVLYFPKGSKYLAFISFQLDVKPVIVELLRIADIFEVVYRVAKDTLCIAIIG